MMLDLLAVDLLCSGALIALAILVILGGGQ
jgi:hypothetical protein